MYSYIFLSLKITRRLNLKSFRFRQKANIGRCIRSKGSGRSQEKRRIEDQPVDDHDHPIGLMKLPPLQEAMAVVGIFLNTLDSVLPLFHADTLLCMVGECYAL